MPSLSERLAVIKYLCKQNNISGLENLIEDLSTNINNCESLNKEIQKLKKEKEEDENT